MPLPLNPIIANIETVKDNLSPYFERKAVTDLKLSDMLCDFREFYGSGETVGEGGRMGLRSSLYGMRPVRSLSPKRARLDRKKPVMANRLHKGLFDGVTAVHDYYDEIGVDSFALIHKPATSESLYDFLKPFLEYLYNHPAIGSCPMYSDDPEYVIESMIRDGIFSEGVSLEIPHFDMNDEYTYIYDSCLTGGEDFGVLIGELVSNNEEVELSEEEKGHIETVGWNIIGKKYAESVHGEWLKSLQHIVREIEGLVDSEGLDIARNNRVNLALFSTYPETLWIENAGDIKFWIKYFEKFDTLYSMMPCAWGLSENDNGDLTRLAKEMVAVSMGREVVEDDRQMTLVDIFEEQEREAA